MTFSSIISWQLNREKVEAVTGFIFLGSKITTDGDCSHEIKRHLLLGRKAMIPSSVQFNCSVVSDSLRPHELQHASLPVYHQLPEYTQTHVHRVTDAIQPSHPRLPLLLLPPIPPSIRVFSNESTLR